MGRANRKVVRMTLIALKSFYDRYKGRVSEGEIFFEPIPRNAIAMIRRGLAREHIIYETKVITAGVQPVAQPFPDVPPPDPEPPALAALRAAMCAPPVVDEQGNPGGVQRRKRGRPRKPRPELALAGGADNRSIEECRV